MNEKTILVIDDDEAIRDALQRVLTRKGYNVLLATSGRTGIELILSHTIHVIVSDILMEDLSGIDLVHWAKDKEIEIPIILITGNPSLSSAGEAVRYNAFDYIPKPVESAQILDVIQRAIHKYAEIQKNKNKLLNSQIIEYDLIKKNWDLNKQNEAIFRATKDCVITVNSNLIIIYANDATFSMLGYKENAILGNSISILFPPEKVKFYNRVVKYYIKNILKTETNQVTDIQLKNVEGKIIDCDLSFCLYTIDSNDYATGIIRDNTQKNRLIQKLIDSERRAFLTTIASSIGHEINNSLSAILGFIDLAMQPNAMINIKDKAIHVTMTQVQKLKNLSNNLLSLGAKQNIDPSQELLMVSDLNNCLKNVIDLFQNSKRLKYCEVNLTQNSDPLNVKGNPDKIGLALSNIILNAADATDNRGNIQITTFLGKSGPAISIQDNGKGMDEDILENLYEPYFSTKGQSKGTGLGMFVVKEICDLYGILIDLETKVNHGTKFTLNFPAIF
jgi:two-component system sporulation sensor kinase A